MGNCNDCGDGKAPIKPREEIDYVPDVPLTKEQIKDIRKRTKEKMDNLCIHLGSIVGRWDCGCKKLHNLHQCELGGTCLKKNAPLDKMKYKKRNRQIIEVEEKPKICEACSEYKKRGKE
jgi:hypothetical protein